MEAVTVKRNYYRRWGDGEFGNKPMSWGTIDALEESSYNGQVNIRHTTPGSEHVKFWVPKSKCRAWIETTGVPASEFRFNEPVPDSKITLQGELLRDHRGLCLLSSKAKLPMREAMRVASTTTGLAARMLLQEACDPESLDWLETLLDRYPQHALEFTTFSSRLGSLHLNTVIWEVRMY